MLTRRKWYQPHALRSAVVIFDELTFDCVYLLNLFCHTVDLTRRPFYDINRQIDKV